MPRGIFKWMALAAFLSWGLGAAQASPMTSSYTNERVTSFDLNAQGWRDWGRWEDNSGTASARKEGGTILSDTIARSSSSGSVWNSDHRFVQGTSDRDMITAQGSSGKLTVTLNLVRGSRHSVFIYGRCVNIANRNDVRITATVAGQTDVLDIPRTLSEHGGAFIYQLDIEALPAGETLTIELSVLEDEDTTARQQDRSVRLGAVGVAEEPLPADGTAVRFR